MLNRIYIIVGLVAIVALAAAFIAPRFIQWGDYRDRMELLAEGVFGTEVSIRGDIDFALLPAPRLSFSDVVIGPPDQPVATVAAIDAEFGLMDFLRDRYNLSALVLKSPSIAFALDESGLLVSGVDLSGAGAGVALNQARIEGGRLALTDRRSGIEYELSELSGDLRLGSFAGPFQFQGGAAYGGAAYSLRVNSGAADAGGSAKLSAFIGEASGRRSLSLDGQLMTGQAPKFDGTMQFKQAPPQASNAGEIRGSMVLESKVAASTDRVVLNGYTLLPDENRAGMRLTGAASIQLGTRSTFEAVVSGGVFSLPPRDAAEEARSMPYELVRLLSELPAPPLPPIPGEIGIDLAEISLRGAALRNVRVDASTNGSIWTVKRAEAELQGGTSLVLSGALRNDSGTVGFNGELAMTTGRLDALSQLWRKAAEDSPLFNVPAELSGQVMLAGDALGFSHGRLLLNGKVHALEVRLGFGSEPRLDIVGRLDDLAPGDSAIVAAMLPDPGADSAFGVSFPEGSFSVNSRAIRVLGLDAADLIAEGSWSASGIKFARLASTDLGGASVDVEGALAGTLTAPVISGSGHVDVALASAPGLLALYDFLDIPPSWRQHIGRAAPASLDFRLAAQDEPGSQSLSLNGRAGAALFDLSVDAVEGLTHAAEGQIKLVGSLEAEDGAALASQLGLGDEPLFSGDDPALVSFFAEGAAEAGFDARVSFGQGDEILAYAGEMSVLEDGDLAGTGTLDVAINDASGLAALVGGKGVGLGQVEGTAAIEFFGMRSVAVTGIAATTNDVPFSGDITLEQVAQRPSLQGQLHFDSIAGEALAAALFSPAALVPGDGAWPEGPLASANQPRPSRGTIAVSAGEMLWGETRIEDASLDLIWDAQSLQISNLKGNIGGGSIGATLSQCCAGPLTDRTVSGRLSLEDVELAALAPSSAVSGLSAGVTGSVSFEGTGASLAEVVSSLAGEGNLTLADFSVERFAPSVYPAVAGLDDVLNTEADVLTILIDQALGQGPFMAESATGAFTIAGGTLRLANFIVESTGAKLAGSLAVALSSLGLQGDFVLTPFEYMDESGLIEPDSARIIARLGGTVTAPAATVDLSEMVAAIQVRANELEVDRLEVLRLEDEARQRAAAQERNRLIEEQRRKAAAEAAARAAAEEAARQEVLQEQPAPTPLAPTAPFDMTPETPGSIVGPLNLGFQPGMNMFNGSPVNQPAR